MAHGDPFDGLSSVADEVIKTCFAAPVPLSTVFCCRKSDHMGFLTTAWKVLSVRSKDIEDGVYKDGNRRDGIAFKQKSALQIFLTGAV